MINNHKNEEEKMETSNLVHAYAKADLAMKYNPQLSPITAMQLLRRWIAYNKDLTHELQAIGYVKSRHYFTPLEVRLIFQYLGEP